MWVTNLVPEYSYGAASVSLSTAYDQDLRITRSYPKRDYVQSFNGSQAFMLGNRRTALSLAEFEFSFTQRVLAKAYDTTTAALQKYVHQNLFIRGYRDGNLSGAPVVLKTSVTNLRSERQFGKIKWTLSGKCLPFWYDASETVQQSWLTNAVATNNYSFSLANHNYIGDVMNVYDDFMKLEFNGLAGTHSYSGIWFLTSHADNNIGGISGDEKLELYGGPSGNGPSVSYPTNKLVIKPSSIEVRNMSTDALVSDGSNFGVRPAYSGVVNYIPHFFAFHSFMKPYVAHIFTANVATTLNAYSKFRNLWW